MTATEQVDRIIRDVARGQIFKTTRIIYGYEQQQMADILGISKSLICLIENGRRSITTSVMKKYLEFFKVEQSKFDKAENKVITLMKQHAGIIEIIYVIVKMLRKS